MTSAPEFLNTIGLAGRWGISPRTLESWRRRRVGPRFLRVGGAVRYPIAEVECYEAEQLVSCRRTAVTEEGEQ